jgi:WD40 repeat protein
MIGNPFPGPQPYRASDRSRFHGREEMAYHLEGYVLANACVTVYGPSGAGKSSLVQAAVLPALVDKQEIRVVRVDGWPEDQDPTTWLADALYHGLELGERPGGVGAADALLAAVQRAARRSPRLVVVYLDQMEQLLYASRDARASAAFFDCLNRLVELPIRNLRVVLSLREDYLGRFRDYLRDQRRVLDHGFRVGPLTVAELCQAVCHAAASGEPPQIWEPDAMRSLMIQVRVPGQAATEEAEGQAAYAQIVCRALFQERAEGGGAGSEIEAEPILQRYLEATLAGLGGLRAAADRLLEDHLVTVDGSRTLRTEKELLRVLPAEQLLPVLAALEGAAILHAEEHQGSRYFEIGHDWLARKVFDQRSQREQAEAKRKERAEAAARIAHAHARRRQFAGIAIGAIVFAVWAYGRKLYAEGLQRDALKARDEASDLRILAGVRELWVRGQLAWAVKLLPEVKHPEALRGWVELANDALESNALRATLRGHGDALSAAAWSPDGKRVLTASADRTALIWSADGTGMPIPLRGHQGPLLSAAWSPDGQRVLTSSEDKTARIWSADGKELTALTGHEGPVTWAAWSPDGKRVVTASGDGKGRVFRADGTGKAEVVLEGHEDRLTSAAWSPDGKRVVTTSLDKTARIFRADGTGKADAVLTHDGPVTWAAWSPDSGRVVTASTDATARIWDAVTGRELTRLLGHRGVVYHAAWSPDGTRVATASDDRTARVWDAGGKGQLESLEGHTGAVLFVSWSPDGKRVATASVDRTARVFSAADGDDLLRLTGHEAPVLSVTWSPDGSRLLTASHGRALDHTAKVWSAAEPGSPRDVPSFHDAFIDPTGQRVVGAYDDGARVFRVDAAHLALDPAPGAALAVRDTWVTCAAPSPDGARVVVASLDGKARVFHADGTGDPVMLVGHTDAVRSAAWSPDGARVVTASDDRTARVFRADGTPEAVLKGHEDWLTSASWSPDGKRVVTTSRDGTARVGSADGTGAPTAVMRAHQGPVYWAAWSPDGRRIVSTSEDRTARIWSADGSGEPRVLKHDAAVLRAIWSDDGQRVATSSADGTVSVWSAVDERPPVVLAGRTPALAMAFIEGGKELLTLATDDGVHVWSLDVDALKQRLLDAHADCLPPDVRADYLPESAAEARSGFEACERGHHREPLPGERKEPPEPGERRVKLLVAPGDATVEIDGFPGARWDGMIELVGKVGQPYRVRVSSRDAQRHGEARVTLLESGASPPRLDLATMKDAPGTSVAGTLARAPSVGALDAADAADDAAEDRPSGPALLFRPPRLPPHVAGLPSLLSVLPAAAGGGGLPRPPWADGRPGPPLPGPPHPPELPGPPRLPVLRGPFHPRPPGR